MKFKALLEQWKRDEPPPRTAEVYPIRLNLDDAARLHALAELFPGQRVDELLGDLVHAALDEVAEAMPYEPGPKVTSLDDQGDPVYEDVGMTPKFVELTRAFKKTLKSSDPGPGASS